MTEPTHQEGWKFAQEIAPWVTTLLLSAWGGLVQYAQRVRKGDPFSYRALALDLIISSFAGVLTWLLCESGGISGPMAAVLIAISGHMGTRTITSLESFRERVFGGRV